MSASLADEFMLDRFLKFVGGDAGSQNRDQLSLE
jgi:hypothetical protein